MTENGITWHFSYFLSQIMTNLDTPDLYKAAVILLELYSSPTPTLSSNDTKVIRKLLCEDKVIEETVFHD